MAITSYVTLKAAIQSWAKREDIDSVIDDFIDLAEADIWRGLRVREMEARATASTSGRFLELPQGFLQMRKMRLISGAESYELQVVSPESMSVDSGSSMPRQYTITNQIEFNVVPSGTYSVEMSYFQSLTPLSSTNASNAVLASYPQIYLFAAMNHFGVWAQDQDIANSYYANFSSEVEKANKAAVKARYGAAKVMKREGRIA